MIRSDFVNVVNVRLVLLFPVVPWCSEVRWHSKSLLGGPCEEKAVIFLWISDHKLSQVQFTKEFRLNFWTCFHLQKTRCSTNPEANACDQSRALSWDGARELKKKTSDIDIDIPAWFHYIFNGCYTICCILLAQSCTVKPLGLYLWLQLRRPAGGVKDVQIVHRPWTLWDT